MLTVGDGAVVGNLDAVGNLGNAERGTGQPGDGRWNEKISERFDFPDSGNCGERVHGDLHIGKRVNFDVRV